jgi:DNA-directed RNA polymerase subunit RPC12/RpoP
MTNTYYECPYCGQDFDSMEELDIHLDLAHSRRLVMPEDY